MATSPSQRTLNYLRKQGWPHVEVVEKWIPQAKRRKDLFGFCDVLAVHPEWGHLYVQVTTGANVNARLYKIREYSTQVVENIVLSGASVEIHGWRKIKHGNRHLWEPRIIPVGLEELYSMNNDDWKKVEDAIDEAFLMVNAVGTRDECTAVATFVDYPPMIRIEVKLLDDPDEQTSKHMTDAVELAHSMAEKALGVYPWLVFQSGCAPSRTSLIFHLRPKSYNELADSI